MPIHTLTVLRFRATWVALRYHAINKQGGVETWKGNKKGMRAETRTSRKQLMRSKQVVEYCGKWTTAVKIQTCAVPFTIV